MFKWWARRRQRRETVEFDRGYGWVMTCHHLYGFPLDYLYEQVYAQFNSGKFEEGAHAALRHLANIERAPKNPLA